MASLPCEDAAVRVGADESTLHLPVTLSRVGDTADDDDEEEESNSIILKRCAHFAEKGEQD